MKTSILLNNYKQYILTVATEVLPICYNRKYSYEYYLTQFDFVLNNGIKWELLPVSNTSKYHCQTIYNEFNRWCNNNIFELAWIRFMKNNYHKINNIRKSRYF